MTATPPATLVVCLIVVCVVLFVLGVYWLRRTRHQLQPRRTRPREAAWRPDRRSFDPQDDEWEAMAPYPEQATRAVHQARFTGQARPGTSAFRDARDPTPADTPHPVHDLHDEWESFCEESQPDTTSASLPARATAPHVHCPHCRSSRIDMFNRARKAGSTIGSVAGATSGMAMALSGAEAGAAVGAIGGPLGSIFGGLAGAVIAGLVGSAVGCAAGSAVGAAIDENILDNYRCLACGHAFSVQHD